MMLTWRNGDGRPVCLPTSRERRHRRSLQVSDTPHPEKKAFNFTHSDKDNIVYRQTYKVVIQYQNGDDAFVLLLDQVTNDLVVKVLHRLPLTLKVEQRSVSIVMYIKIYHILFVLTTQLTAIPSVSYSSCSDLRVSSMNSCWSFSLQ